MKKKNSKSKKPVNRKSKSGLPHGGNDLSQKVLSTMEKLKEVGIIVQKVLSTMDKLKEVRIIVQKVLSTMDELKEVGIIVQKVLSTMDKLNEVGIVVVAESLCYYFPEISLHHGQAQGGRNHRHSGESLCYYSQKFLSSMDKLKEVGIFLIIAEESL